MAARVIDCLHRARAKSPESQRVKVARDVLLASVMWNRIGSFKLPVAVVALAAWIGGCANPNDFVDESSAAVTVRNGVDYSFARPSPSGLHAGGYTFAARYYSYDNSGTHGKILFAGEANALIAAGVDVVSNWEYGATDALGGFSSGAADAKEANTQAAAAGAPASRPIYFSVDFDATPGDQTAINAYMDGAASVIGLGRVGAYGGYYVVKRLFDAGKIKFGWQTYAWSGGQWDPRAQLRQVQNGITAAGDANCCDEDQSQADDFGQWGHAAPWGAKFVSQSFPYASTAITLKCGESLPANIVLRNVGSKSWDTNTRLGTTQPRDRASLFAASTWLAPNRLSHVTGTVAPNATFQFDFTFQAPSGAKCVPGTHHEYFGVLEEAVAWFSDSGEGGPADDQLEALITLVPGNPPPPDMAHHPVTDLGHGVADLGDTADLAGDAPDLTSAASDAATTGPDLGAIGGGGGNPGGPTQGGCGVAGAPHGTLSFASLALLLLLLAAAAAARRHVGRG